MCTNGINTGQFEMMIEQIDDHLKLERRWAHALGHKAGDAMLQLVGRYCTEQFPRAQVFRLGGDEFLLIIQRMEHCKVTEGMEELDRRVQAAGYSIAYGVEFRRSCFNLEDMTNCADNKMLGAKAEHYKQFDRRRH